MEVDSVMLTSTQETKLMRAEDMLKYRMDANRVGTCIEAADSDDEAKWKPWNGPALLPMVGSGTRTLRQTDTLIDSGDGIEHPCSMCISANPSKLKNARILNIDSIRN